MYQDVHYEVPLAATFPLPFRALFLIGLGILGWATNLHVLHLLGIDAPRTLEFQTSTNRLPLRSSSSGRLSARSFYEPLYRIFIGYTGWCFATWIVFRTATYSDAFLVDMFRFVPAVCMLVVVTVLVCPLDVFYKRERDWFICTAARCLYLASNDSVYLSDVIFADVSTSFAKVLGDLWLSLCMLLPGGSLFRLPSQDGWYQWVVPCLMSLPYLIRLRQCLTEYHSPMNTTRRPFFNAIKYATSFPVIFLSAAQRIVISDLVHTRGYSVVKQGWHGEHPLFRLWLMSVLINSLYSFWWDVTNDWGLDLLVSKSAPSRGRSQTSPSRQFDGVSTRRSQELNPSIDQTSSAFDAPGRRKAAYPYGLRTVLLYPLAVYPMAIFLDFILRMTWSIKLSSHLHALSDGSTLVLWLEVAEVLRRWIWVFLRIEWEIAKGGDGVQASGNGNGRSMAADEIELLQAHSKDPVVSD